MLQEKLDQPISLEKGSSLLEQDDSNMGALSDYVRKLKGDVTTLREQLVSSQTQC